MMLGLGLDLVERDRIDGLIERYGERFFTRVLTPAERAALPRDPRARAAGLFAAKEAAVKALGTGFALGIGFHDLEILSDALGRPVLDLTGPARDRALALGASSWHLTITHTRTTAAAVVVLEGEKKAPPAAGGDHPPRTP